MKQRTLLLPLAASLLIAGCDDMLVETPEAFLTTDTYYRTADDLNSATLSTYANLRTGLSGPFGVGWGWALATIHDQGQTDPGEPNATTVGPDFLNYTPTAPNNTDGGWDDMFNTIYRANLVISRAPGIAMPEAQRAQLVAEAKFARAYAYLWLDKLYSSGNKPSDLSMQLILSEEDHAKDNLPRSTVAEVHAAIIEDLTEAEAALPASRPATQRGRATKGAAQMALADLYLWRSSFMLTNEWQQASTWSKKVIDSGQYALNNNFFATWDPAAKANNRESIFFFVASGTQGRSTSGYAATFWPRALGSNRGGGWGVAQPTTWHLNSYAPGDFRGVVGPTSDTVAYRNRACRPTGECFDISPHVWKFRPSSILLNQGDVDVTLYRFAEALLMYAEAQNELGNTAEAMRHVNLIRARARRGTGTEDRAQPADLPTDLSRQAARDALYMERSWEFAHELKRWFDLVRRDSMEPGFWLNSLVQHDPNATRQRPDLAQRLYLKRWPIPQREIDNDPALVQNPGY